MSDEDAEIPGRVLDAWNRRDLEAILELSDPEVEYVNAPTAIEPGTRHGHEGLTKVMRNQWDGLSGIQQEIDRVEVRGDEIFTIGRISRPMPGSDSQVENRILLSWKVRDGKVVRLAVLGAGSDFHDALEAAGLDE